MTRNVRNWLYGICFLALLAGINSRFWFDSKKFDKKMDTVARMAPINPTLVTEGTFGQFGWLTVECASSPTGAVWDWTVHPRGFLALLGMGFVIAMPLALLWRLGVNLDWLRERCDICGYSRQGLEIDRCPECGSTLKQETEFEHRVLYEMGFGRGIIWRFVVLAALFGLTFAFTPLWAFVARLHTLAVGAGAAPPTPFWPMWQTSIPLYIAMIWTVWAFWSTTLRLRTDKPN